MKFLHFSIPFHPRLNSDRALSRELGRLFLEFSVLFGGFFWAYHQKDRQQQQLHLQIHRRFYQVPRNENQKQDCLSRS